MNMKSPTTKALSVVAASIIGIALLSGCAAKVAVIGVAQSVLEDRQTEEQIVDTKIKIQIIDNNINIDKALALDLSVDVWKSRVMITGAVSEPQQRDIVASMALKDERIHKLINEIIIVSPEDQDQRRAWLEKAQDGVAETFDDIWIATKINAQLISTRGINSVNMRWRSVLGEVSILGEAQTHFEMERVLAIIQNTKGVKAVHNHIVVRG